MWRGGVADAAAGSRMWSMIIRSTARPFATQPLHLLVLAVHSACVPARSYRHLVTIWGGCYILLGAPSWRTGRACDHNTQLIETFSCDHLAVVWAVEV